MPGSGYTYPSGLRWQDTDLGLTNATLAEQAGAPLQHLIDPGNVHRTWDRWLLDPLGERVIVRGVETTAWKADWQNLEQWIVEIAKTGANVCRVLPMTPNFKTFNGGVFLDNTTVGGYSNAEIENHVNLCIDHGMICDMAYEASRDPDCYLRDDVYDLLKPYESHLLMHLLGESGDLTGAQWVQLAAPKIIAHRQRGWQCPFYIICPNNGRNLNVGMQFAQQIIDADPLRNVVMGWQAYWGASGYWQYINGMSLAEAAIEIKNANYPIQVGAGALGDFGDGFIDYWGLLQDCADYDIGWLWWDWRTSTGNLTFGGIYGTWDSYPFGSQAPPGLFNGEQIAVTEPYSIKNTSVRHKYQLDSMP